MLLTNKGFYCNHSQGLQFVETEDLQLALITKTMDCDSFYLFCVVDKFWCIVSPEVITNDTTVVNDHLFGNREQE